MFFKDLFGDKKPEDISIPEFVAGALAHEAKIPKEPSERVFGGLKRDPKTGRFDDGAMVQILQESIEDPAGKFLFGNILIRIEECCLISLLLQGLLAQGTCRNICVLSKYLASCNPGSGKVFQGVRKNSY